MAVLKLALLFGILGVVYSKPIEENNVLPHSRDYYAGYIKAITDNFEQLFAGERQVRSTGEDDEKTIDTSDEARRSTGAESAKDIKHYDGSKNFLMEMKRDVSDDEPAGGGNKINGKAVKPDSASNAKKMEVKGSAVLKLSEDKDAKAEKKSSPEESITAQDPDIQEPTTATVKGDSNESPPVIKVSSNAATVKDAIDREDNMETVSAPDVDSARSTDETGGIETEQEEAGNEDASEMETEPAPEQRSVMPEGEMSEEEMRRNYILEHADMRTMPLFPGIVSGYRQSAPYAGDFGEYGGANMYPVTMPFAPGPYGFSMPSEYSMMNGLVSGEARSNIKSSKHNKGHKKSLFGSGSSANSGSNSNADSHHLQRILLTPEDCHGHGCGHSGHGCGHHDCGHHGLVHDIHHWPVGCPEPYSHDSPCLTYPHGNHVTYGWPQAGDCSCGCDCAVPWHSHHPVVLHPTYQETHHHNIHVVPTGCHHHDDCGCHHHSDCGCHHVHCAPEECHHGCTTITTGGHHGHHDHYGHDADIAMPPHYGHTCAGSSGWNPYWGY